VGFGWNTDELADHGVPAGKRRAVLADYLAAMQALWSQDEASYHGEFVSFGASWAWPKPAQPRIPVLAGAGGSERTFRWIARCADGWLTTPGETGLDGKVALLHQAWREAGRDGQPRVTALAGKPDPELLTHWAQIGVTDVAFGLPDRSPQEVAGYLGRLAGRLGLATAVPGPVSGPVSGPVTAA
jgi:alkanesulfonate monooxygenase SsuD/methylene tetrahydromethanopterin reductase-like flavin-dependent oxidoreductase (luciferase family)